MLGKLLPFIARFLGKFVRTLIEAITDIPSLFRAPLRLIGSIFESISDVIESALGIIGSLIAPLTGGRDERSSEENDNYEESINRSSSFTFITRNKKVKKKNREETKEVIKASRYESLSREKRSNSDPLRNMIPIGVRMRKGLRHIPVQIHKQTSKAA